MSKKIGKEQVTLWIDADVMEWLEGQDEDYQSRINAVLWAYYEAHRDNVR